MLSIKRFSVDDAEQAKKFFDENGFVILRNAFNHTCLTDFNAEVSEIIRAHLRKAKSEHRR